MVTIFAHEGMRRGYPIEGPQIPKFVRRASIGSSIMEYLKKCTNSIFMDVFKCHWFDPSIVRWTPNVVLVEIRQSSVFPGDDVYIVAE